MPTAKLIVVSFAVLLSILASAVKTQAQDPAALKILQRLSNERFNPAVPDRPLAPRTRPAALAASAAPHQADTRHRDHSRTEQPRPAAGDPEAAPVQPTPSPVHRRAKSRPVFAHRPRPRCPWRRSRLVRLLYPTLPVPTPIRRCTRTPLESLNRRDLYS